MSQCKLKICIMKSSYEVKNAAPVCPARSDSSILSRQALLESLKDWPTLYIQLSEEEVTPQNQYLQRNKVN